MALFCWFLSFVFYISYLVPKKSDYDGISDFHLLLVSLLFILLSFCFLLLEILR